MGWTAPADNGAAITDYVIEHSTDGVTWTTVNDGVSADPWYTVGGLTNGTEYRFRVGAKNAAGVGDWAELRATPRWSPATTTGVTAEVVPSPGVGSGQVKLRWTAPPDNGAAITDYIIRYATNAFASQWTDVNDGVSTATSYTIGGLIDGTRYFFRVYAVNAVGQGFSEPVPATPLGPLAAPGGLAAAVAPADGVSSGEVKLTWTGSDGSATDYKIERSIDGATWTPVDDGVSTATSYTVGGLTNGTEYTFRVAATGPAKLSPWSEIHATPLGTPAAPREVTAEVAPADGVGSGEVKFRWTAPDDVGGTEVTDYVIQHSLDGTAWTTVDDGVSAETAYRLSGLVDGTAYHFRIGAKNAVGVGGWSAVGATPMGAPPAPTGVAATVAPAPGVGSGEVHLDWDVLPVGPAAISGYVIRFTGDGDTRETVVDADLTTTTFTVDGLTNGTSYSFRIAALNVLGAGPWSATVQATPLWSPDAPAGLTGVVAPAGGVRAGQVKLTWSAPSSNGAPITDYVIESSADGVTWTEVGDFESTATTFTVAGLTNGTPYRFRVAALNTLGRGPWSEIEATPAAAPTAPAGLTVALAPVAGIRSGEAKLAWTAPSGNGSAITDYVIQRSGDGTQWTTVNDGMSPAAETALRGLVNGTRYYIRLAGRNAVGVGDWSTPVVVTPRWKPAAPSGLRAAVSPAGRIGSGQVKLTWTAPAARGARITDYVIQRAKDGKRWVTVADGVSRAPARLLSGLTNDTRYRFRVAARNIVGVGPWSRAIRATPHAR
jgi:titin